MQILWLEFSVRNKGEPFSWRVLVLSRLLPGQASVGTVHCSPAAHLHPELATVNLIPGCSQGISGNGALQTHL